MKQIKTYVNYNNYSKTHYSQHFTILEKLPKIRDVLYEDSSNLEIVEYIENIKIDCEQPYDYCYNYNYYRLTIFHYDKDTKEEDYIDEYIAIQK